MRSNHALRPIGAGAIVYSGFAFRSEDFAGAGIPVVKIKNVNNRTVDLTDTQFFPESKVTDKHAKFFLTDGDVLIAMTGQGSVGRVGRLRLNREKVLLNQRVGKFVVDPAELDRDYLYYVISTPRYEQILFDAGAGSGQPNLSPDIICSVKIPFPPLAEQKSIAAVLGALDDKIELNRRMNTTLEAMARALFQSWFVDFDPVRAKLDGRQPTGLDPATASLFPNEFEDSELGPIPRGWRVGKVSDSFDLTMGQSPPGETYNEEGKGLPFYQGRADFGFRFPTRRVFCTAPTRLAKVGDTLVSVRAPVGDINMADEDCCVGRGVAAVRHKSGASSFTYYAMENFESDFARFEAEGTVFGSINKQDFAELPFVVSAPQLIAAYERVASPFDRRIRVAEHESRTLASVRDALLPKLLSGDLRAYHQGLHQTAQSS